MRRLIIWTLIVMFVASVAEAQRRSAPPSNGGGKVASSPNGSQPQMRGSQPGQGQPQGQPRMGGQAMPRGQSGQPGIRSGGYGQAMPRQNQPFFGWGGGNYGRFGGHALPGTFGGLYYRRGPRGIIVIPSPLFSALNAVERVLWSPVLGNDLYWGNGYWGLGGYPFAYADGQFYPGVQYGYGQGTGYPPPMPAGYGNSQQVAEQATWQQAEQQYLATDGQAVARDFEQRAEQARQDKAAPFFDQGSDGIDIPAEVRNELQQPIEVFLVSDQERTKVCRLMPGASRRVSFPPEGTHYEATGIGLVANDQGQVRSMQGKVYAQVIPGPVAVIIFK